MIYVRHWVDRIDITITQETCCRRCIGYMLTRFVRTIISASCIYHDRLAMIYVDAEKTGQTLKGLSDVHRAVATG